jgi:holo-[acyl-carrier protein] synthase
MILGVGVDVCEVRRMRQALARAAFRRRVFDAVETRDCERRARREEHYAARFAAKEAFFKALGSGWAKGMGWSEVAVRSADGGAPSLRLGGAALRRARARGVVRAHVSLSHSGDYAVAVVVLEGRGGTAPGRGGGSPGGGAGGRARAGRRRA